MNVIQNKPNQSQFQTQKQFTLLAGREIAASAFPGCAINVKRFFADFFGQDAVRIGELILEARGVSNAPGLLFYTAQALTKAYLPPLWKRCFCHSCESRNPVFRL